MNAPSTLPEVWASLPLSLGLKPSSPALNHCGKPATAVAASILCFEPSSMCTRVSLVVTNSLTSFSKVCSSDSIKISRFLSTTADSLDFQSPNASQSGASSQSNHNPDYPLDSLQNPNLENHATHFVGNPDENSRTQYPGARGAVFWGSATHEFQSNSGQTSRGNGLPPQTSLAMEYDGSLQARVKQNADGFVSRLHWLSGIGLNQNPPENIVNSSNDRYVENADTFRRSPSSLHHEQNQTATQLKHPAYAIHLNQSAGQYPCSPDGFHTGTMPSCLSTRANPHANLAEVPGTGQMNATLEKLDGYCKDGKAKEAVEVLDSLDKQGVPVDVARLLQLVRVCGEAKVLQEAKAVHEYITRSLSDIQVSTYNKILVMYSKCCSMDDAFDVFEKMPRRNLTTWDTMISWLAKNGLGEDAIDLFTQFKKAGLKPDPKIFAGVFSACSSVGDVNEGMLHFESMSKDYGIVPTMKNYVSVVEMLGSVGYLNEAVEFIEKMPLEPSIDVWETLMSLCRVHGNLELGDRCAKFVEQLDPSRLDEKSKVGLISVKASDTVEDKEKKNVQCKNILEVRSRVHEYRAGDKSHPESDKIYTQLRCLKEQMKEAGYIPETRFVLHDVDQESKEEAIHSHSERLAVAQGLMSSAARSPIRIIKNLRICGDCHVSMKIISKIVGRELIIRDAKRFHHFRDGICSCRDYW